MMNELVRNQCDVTNHQVNVQFLLQLQPEWQRSQQAVTRNKGKAIVNSPPPTYDQEPDMKIYKPTNKNLRTSSNTSKADQDNTPRINRRTGYDNKRVVKVVGARENVDAADNSGPIFDAEPLQKLLESSNKTLVDKLKGEIEDFKTKNKSLESSNDHFKEANNELSKTNQLMFKDLKKFLAELDRYHDVNYASKVEIDYAKAKCDLMSYKMESQKSFNEYTRKINDLNQMILEMKKELIAHQETISIISQEKEARNKFHKTREDKELEKIIALENKIKVLDDIFLKKAQRANPRLYDIGCYNDNLALMLAPESNDTILDSLKSQLEIQKTQLLNEIDRLSREYYYADHMNAILGVYTKLDEVINLQCDYFEALEKCQSLENELSKRNTMSKSFEALQQHAINPELATSNVNFVCVTCGKCVLNDNHDMCVLHYINGVNTRTKQPIAIPISTREHKRTVNQSVATPLKKATALEPTNQKLRSTTRKQYEHVSTIKFRNDQIAPILGYYVEGLNHNLLSVGQFYDADLEVAFQKSTCYIRDLKGNDILIGSPGTYLYSFTLQDTSTPNPIFLMAKATSSQACQENVSQAAETVTTSNELDLLFSLMFDDILNGTTPVVSKSSAETAVDAPNQRQQQNTTPSTSTTVVVDAPPMNI
ncbi:hypothetical protein Tco_1130770 [Tanacetum coccineum]